MESKDKSKILKKELEPRIYGNIIGCENIGCLKLDDEGFIKEMGNLKQSQQVPPRNILMCLNCSMVKQVEFLLQVYVKGYEEYKKQVDEEFFNQRTKWKKMMKPMGYVETYIDFMKDYLEQLKKFHQQEFQDVKNECENQEEWW